MTDQPNDLPEPEPEPETGTAPLPAAAGEPPVTSSHPRWVLWTAGAGLLAVGMVIGGGVALAVADAGDDRPRHGAEQGPRPGGPGQPPDRQAAPPELPGQDGDTSPQPEATPTGQSSGANA